MYSLQTLTPTQILGKRFEPDSSYPDQYYPFQETPIKDLPSDIDSVTKARLWMISNHPEMYIGCEIHQQADNPNKFVYYSVHDPNTAAERGEDAAKWFENSRGHLNPDKKFLKKETKMLEQAVELQGKLQDCFTDWAQNAEAMLQLDPTMRAELDSTAKEFNQIYNNLSTTGNIKDAVQALSKSTHLALNNIAQAIAIKPQTQEKSR